MNKKLMTLSFCLLVAQHMAVAMEQGSEEKGLVCDKRLVTCEAISIVSGITCCSFVVGPVCAANSVACAPGAVSMTTKIGCMASGAVTLASSLCVMHNHQKIVNAVIDEKQQNEEKRMIYDILPPKHVPLK